MKHLGTQVLGTDRLLLRPFQKGDAQMMYDNWASDDEVTRYLLWSTHENVEETEEAIESWEKLYEKKNYYHWAIVHKESGQVIGSTVLFDFRPCWWLPFKKHSAEVGYCLGRKWWKQGIAQEAVSAILEYAFVTLSLKQMVARHDHRNPASGQVMQRLGMTHTHFRRSAERGRDGKWIDCDYYKLRRNQYFSAESLVTGRRFLYNKQ